MKLISIRLLTVLLLVNYLAYGQKKVKDYVQSNSVQVQHLNIAEDDFTDLEPLGEAIGNTRIVSLGEQMHGDGTAFEAKGRIIKYLHEKKGFNVVVFESDFFGLTYGFEKVEKSKDSLHDFIYHNVLGLWSWCRNAGSFFYNYVYQTQSTAAPLILAGMDCQVQSKYSFANLGTAFKNILFKIVENNQDSLYAKVALDNLPTVFFNGQKANPAGCENGLNALQNILSNKSLKQLNEEELNILNNVKAAYLNILPYLQNKMDAVIRHRFRDRQMFNNLMWLLQYKYPNEKIIIWAHNVHIMKSVDEFEDNQDIAIMTGHFLGNKKMNPFGYYAIGFTSFHATSIWAATITQPFYAQTPARNSFERWIDKEWDYAFTDWKKLNAGNSGVMAFSMKGSTEATQHKNFVYKWSKAFDGVFFIRNLEGCERLPYEELIKK